MGLAPSDLSYDTTFPTSVSSMLSSIDVEGPVSYAYIQFDVNGTTKRIHAFGDRHVNESSCDDTQAISLYDLIANTLAHNIGRVVDVFTEQGFGQDEASCKMGLSVKSVKKSIRI